MPNALSSVAVWRVSSAAIKAALASVSRARALRSLRLPMGVATTYRRPCAAFVTILLVSRRASGELAMQGMPAISLRPRLALAAALALSLLLPACSLVKPEQAEPSSAQERAQRLALAGNHAQAAQTYADLAAQSPPDRDNYELLSAEQWVLANNIEQAKQAFAAVSPEARTTMPASRALVAAEIDLAERDGVNAIHELDTIAVPTSPQLAQSYWWLRGKAAFLTGHPAEGTRAFVERERYIADAEGLRASREELLALI